MKYTKRIRTIKGNRKDLTGQTFGRLTALRPVGLAKQGSVIWRCVCQCGNYTINSIGNLTSGKTKSCGCSLKGNKNGITHGMTRTREYNSWRKMIQRCTNPNDSDYKDYGGRGISVCPEWHEFERFYADMGDRPKGKSIDRIDNDGNYEPSNCKWSDASEQAANRRRKKNSFPVMQVHKDTGTMLKVWDSAAIAEKDGGYNASGISQCLNGRQYTYMCCTWIKLD